MSFPPKPIARRRCRTCHAHRMFWAGALALVPVLVQAAPLTGKKSINPKIERLVNSPERATDNAAINTVSTAVSASIAQSEMQSLSDRLTELRLGEATWGLWSRGVSRRDTNVDSRLASPFEQNSTIMQIGIDKRFLAGDGSVLLGAFGGQSAVDRKFMHSTKGRSDSHHFGLYLTYLEDSGFYAEAAGMYSTIRHSLDVPSQGPLNVNGNVRTDVDGSAFSLALGRNIRWDNNWFFEPRMQVSYYQNEGATLRLPGVGNERYDVKGSTGRSLQYRPGLLLGYAFRVSGGELRPYVKAGWVQESNARNRVQVGKSAAGQTDPSGGRAEFGAGLVASMGAAHSLAASYDYTKGNAKRSPYAASLSYRFVF